MIRQSASSLDSETILDLLPDAVLLVNSGGQIVQQNPAAIGLMGDRLGSRLDAVLPAGSEQPFGRIITRQTMIDAAGGSRTVDVRRRVLADGGEVLSVRTVLAGPDPVVAAMSQHAMIAVSDAKGVILYANDGLCLVSGYSRDALLGRPIGLLSFPSDSYGLPDAVSEVIAAGQVWRGDLHWRRLDGSGFWTHSTVMPFVESDGRTNRVVIVSDDISEQKQLEASYRRTQDHLRKAFQASPMAMSINRFSDGAFLDVNDAFCALTGAEREEIVGRRQRDVSFRCISHAPDELHRHIHTHQPIRDHAMTLQRADGSQRELLGSLETIWVDGETLIIALYADVTDRLIAESAHRTSEERYRTLARHLPNGLVYLFDLNRRLVVADGTEFERIGGSRDAVEGRLLEEVIPAQELSAAVAQFQAALRGVATTTERAVGEATYAVHSHPVRSPAGAIDGVLMLSQNITQRKQHEAALAAANAELISKIVELERRNVEISLLAELGEALQRAATFDEADSVIAAFLPRFFPRHSGIAVMLAAGAMRQVAGWGEDLPIFGPDDCWALVSGKTLVMEVDGPACRHVLSTPALCVPIQARDEVLGLLHLIGTNDRNVVQLATTIAEHLALSLANLRMRETLHHQSIRDSLTGLFNRRYLDDILSREISRADRGNENLAILMLDLDHFKAMNDRYGHDAGDSLLRSFGDFLRTQIRSGDIACRYGGEEFLIVSPASSAPDAVMLAERIRSAMKAMRIDHRGMELPPITVSIGIAVFPEHGQNGRRLVSRADGALYRAKAAGRDRVVLVDGRTGMTVA